MQVYENIADKRQIINSELNLDSIRRAVQYSWLKISPFWPLKNLVAVNPLHGFENIDFEDALNLSQAYFEQEDLPLEMQNVNKETIKWLQAFFDEGQATIKMPLRKLGLFKSITRLLAFDKNIVTSNSALFIWYKNLPKEIYQIIKECLIYLGVPKDNYTEFMALMLTTLPGWASYVKYKTQSVYLYASTDTPHVTKEEYLALRLLLTCFLFNNPTKLLDWHHTALKQANSAHLINNIKKLEDNYRQSLIAKLAKTPKVSKEKIQAQVVFCIDVRSEPFRKALESQGAYETFGFAGFFGLPIGIKNELTDEQYPLCPVLLQPKYIVTTNNSKVKNNLIFNFKIKAKQLLYSIYQSLKYNIVSSFALVETIGLAAGIMTVIRTFFPHLANKFNQTRTEMNNFLPNIVSYDAISLKDQADYALNALRMIGLTDGFAPIVIFCGHGSQTQNNPYASALDCGACNGRHGGINAAILAKILNNQNIRTQLEQKNIFIPNETYFFAAEHNTTTDDVQIFEDNPPQAFNSQILQLKNDLLVAKKINNHLRFTKLTSSSKTPLKLSLDKRAKDWAQVRPEWGLAGNASFIVGPRFLTKNVNLDGRSFLHSYDWNIDEDGSLLSTILTAPMIVAQWINCQYLFSTINNVAFGSGNKITQNITGKIGIMQGNASDLMHGLPLQSVFRTDNQAYHQPIRLLTVVYAPCSKVQEIIFKHEILKKLFANRWVYLICIDPINNQTSSLENDLTWRRI